MVAATDCVRKAASCRVDPAREFELLPVWFYAVESSAPGAVTRRRGAEAASAFARAVSTAAGTPAAALALQGSLWDSFGKEPPPPLQQPAVVLAARALLLFLNPNPNPNPNPNLTPTQVLTARRCSSSSTT